MTKTNFIKSIAQTLLIALFMVFLVSVVSAQFTYRIGEMEAETNVAEDDTLKTEEELHESVSDRQKNLKTYLEDEVLGPAELLYTFVAGNHNMSGRYWDNATVKTYIMWLIRCWVSVILGVIAFIVQLRMQKHSDEEISHGKTKKSTSGLNEVFSDASVWILEVLMLGGALGVLLGHIMLLMVIAVVVAMVLVLLSYTSNGGKLVDAKKREKRGWKALLPKSVVETFNINLEEEDDHGIPKTVRKRSGDGQVRRRESVSLDSYYKKKH